MLSASAPGSAMTSGSSLRTGPSLITIVNTPPSRNSSPATGLVLMTAPTTGCTSDRSDTTVTSHSNGVTTLTASASAVPVSTGTSYTGVVSNARAPKTPRVTTTTATTGSTHRGRRVTDSSGEPTPWCASLPASLEPSRTARMGSSELGSDGVSSTSRGRPTA